MSVFCTCAIYRIHRAALWILGEYCTTIDNIQSLMTEIRTSLGEIPIVDDETRKAKGDSTEGNRDTLYGWNRGMKGGVRDGREYSITIENI